MTARSLQESPRGDARQASLGSRLATNLLLALVLVALLLLRLDMVQTVRVSSINMAPTLELDDRLLVRGYGADPVLGDVVVYRSPFGDGHLQIGRIVATEGDDVEMTEVGLSVGGRPVATAPADAGGGACDAGPGKSGTGAISRREIAPVPDFSACAADLGQAGACGFASGPAPGDAPAGCSGDASLVAAEILGNRLYYTRRAGGLSSLLFSRRTVPAEHVFVLNDNRVDERDSRIYGAIPRYAIVGVASFVYYATDRTGIRWDRMNRRVS